MKARAVESTQRACWVRCSLSAYFGGDARVRVRSGGAVKRSSMVVERYCVLDCALWRVGYVPLRLLVSV